MAAGAYVANLRIADGADHEVLLDRCAAFRAGAVLGELTLAEGDIELLLLAVGEVGVGAQHDIAHESGDRNKRDDGPKRGIGHTAALGIDHDIDHGKDVERDKEAQKRVNRGHKLRRQEL